MVPLGSMKDSRWLTLEVCREFQRSKCQRDETECKFAHPPANVEVQNGRVVCCYDSIKGKCQRKDPPCKYLHPPQHLREQLLQNGRNNLIIKNIQMQMLSQSLAASGQLVTMNGQLINTGMTQPTVATGHNFTSFLGTNGLHMLPTGGDALIGPPPPPPPPHSHSQPLPVHSALNGIGCINGINGNCNGPNAASANHMGKADSPRDCLPVSYSTGKRTPTAAGDNKGGLTLYQPAASFQQLTAFQLSSAQAHSTGAFIPTSFSGHVAAMPRY